MDKIIFHIDVNSAFVSWSAVKLLLSGYKKDIRNEVAVVAGDPKTRHGIIAAASIPAKKLGIKSAMNLYEARKKYNDIIVVKPDFEFYRKCSNSMMMFLRSVFRTVDQFSIDECWVDYSDVKDKYGDEIIFANKLKDYIYKKFGFTVNIGIGYNKLSAKMASDFEKPNKVHTLYKYEFKDKVWPLDISDLFMAGKSSCKKLRSMGINTIGQLACADEDMLVKVLKKHGKLLYEYANGIDDRKLNSENYHSRKSISFSETLSNSSSSRNLLISYLEKFTDKIVNILNRDSYYAKTVVITIRNDDFVTKSRQKKLNTFTRNKKKIKSIAFSLLDELWDGYKVRLIGLGVSNLTRKKNVYVQLSLFDDFD